MATAIKDRIKALTPPPLLYLYRLARDWRDGAACLAFVLTPMPYTSLLQRWRLVYRMCEISDKLPAPHTQAEVLAYMREILEMPESRAGIIVEAGCFKGASTAKFSLAAKSAGRHLVVYDSFEGIPDNHEEHGNNIFGESVGFKPGSFRGGIDEVQRNVERFGDIAVCDLRQGWFDESLPLLREDVAAAYIDVDLASSTYSCLRYIYPRLVPGGRIYSQDGHLPLVIAVFKDEEFWRNELGCAPPQVQGLGKSKIIWLEKPVTPESRAA
jgi:O-methyltransferase